MAREPLLHEEMDRDESKSYQDVDLPKNRSMFPYKPEYLITISVRRKLDRIISLQKDIRFFTACTAAGIILYLIMYLIAEFCNG